MKLGANSVLPVELERGRSVLAVETSLSPGELLHRLLAVAPPNMDIAPLAAEPESVRELYGLDNGRTAGFGRQCLLARRLVEKGVRFVLAIPSAARKRARCAFSHCVPTSSSCSMPACCSGVIPKLPVDPEG